MFNLPRAEIFSPGTGGHRLLGRWYLFIRGRFRSKLEPDFSGVAFLVGSEIREASNNPSYHPHVLFFGRKPELN